MITRTFPKVPGIDLCKSKGKNVMFEAGINKVQRCSEMWLGFDGAYLNSNTLELLGIISRNKYWWVKSLPNSIEALHDETMAVWL
jgi:hypothetical protein